VSETSGPGASADESQPPITVNVFVTPPEEAYAAPAIQPGMRGTVMRGCGCECGSEAGAGTGTSK
jgi:hypothetical protein